MHRKKILIDTGSSQSFIDKYTLSTMDTPNSKSTHRQVFQVANNTTMESSEYIELQLVIEHMITNVKCWILNDMCTGIIVGTDWMTTYAASPSYATRSVAITLNGKQYSTPMLRRLRQQEYQARTCNRIVLKPNEERAVRIYTRRRTFSTDTAMFMPSIKLRYETSQLLPYALLAVCHGKTVITIYNTSNKNYVIHRNTTVGTLTEVLPSKTCFAMTSSVQPKQHQNLNVSQPLTSEVQAIIETTIEHLSDERKRTSRPILQKYCGLFDLSKTRIAKTHIHHPIQTGNHQAVMSRPYTTSLTKQQLIHTQIQTLYKSGLIRPSTSAWASPVVLVTKKDGKPRFCVDYRKINQLTTRDAFPLPNMEETINRLGDAAFFTKLDLKSGYFQIPIREEDKAKTAFITQDGLWEWNVLPQGLKNAPPSFQRIMNNLVANGRWQYCLVYLDDIIVFSKTFDEHIEHLHNILQVLDRANFQLNPSKCSFIKNEIDYLGHTINSKGIKPLKTNIQTIIDIPTPTTSKHVK
ncbi:unnamed protein product, partial [Didymodactylos carnosus]